MYNKENITFNQSRDWKFKLAAKRMEVSSLINRGFGALEITKTMHISPRTLTKYKEILQRNKEIEVSLLVSRVFDDRKTKTRPVPPHTFIKHKEILQTNKEIEVSDETIRFSSTINHFKSSISNNVFM